MIHPILLDARPDYLGEGTRSSLLLTPVGASRLISVIESLAGDGEWQRPSVATEFASDGDYVEGLRAATRVGTVASLSRLLEELTLEPSDWLLFFDARHPFLDPAPLKAMLNDVFRSRLRATHLVTMARHSGGTRERLDVDPEGRIRRVHRYFDAATWPFLTGVACSLVPAASIGAAGAPARLDSLLDLRGWLTSRGVPCRDVTLDGPVFDLRREEELLRLNERLVVDADQDGLVHRDAQVHPEARIVGPVVVRSGAVVDAGATVIGPSVIGPGARVCSKAVVAHCLLGDHACVPDGASVRARTVFAASVPAAGAAPVAEVVNPSEPEDLDLDLPADRALYPRAKAVVEATVAGLALVALTPFFAVTALLIKLESRGTVFFSDVREGRGGRLFRCFKFRTMRTGSQAEQRELLSRNDVDGPQFKLEKDPRLTRLGRWLRPASLDELPQLINVAIGEMSLIGPRPSPFRENQTCVPWRSARLTVRPGITGLWQVCRHDRRDGDFHQWIYFDLLYVQHMSLWVDIKILLATVLTRGGQTHVPVHWIIPARRLSR